MRVKTIAFLDALEDVSAGNSKIPQSEFLPAGELAVVDQGRALIAGYTNDHTATIRSPAPLIVFGDHTRAIKYIDFPFAMGADGVKVLRVRDGLDPKFVYHFLRARRIPSVGYSRHFKFLKSLELPMPPLTDQTRIATILDRADAIRANRLQVHAHLGSLAQSVFKSMFARAAQRSRLGDVATTTSGGTPNRAVAANFGGDIPWVKSGELHSGLITDTEERLSSLGLSSSSAKLLPAGTVLLAMYGATAGVVGRLGIDAATNQAVCSIKPGPRLDAEFLEHALRAQADALASKASGGAQPNLSQATVRDFEIPVPSISDQQRFAKYSKAITQRQIATRRATAAAHELFASLQSRAFRGEL